MMEGFGEWVGRREERMKEIRGMENRVWMFGKIEVMGRIGM